MSKAIYCALTFTATALAIWLLGCFLFMEWLNITTVEPIGRWMWLNASLLGWWMAFGLRVVRWVK